ncbi:MAG TPA: YtxH domain-containing protein [Thermomicrobiales bacterium]|nr:YtxH domain-containing protein [Thermomicrobiales bacterium]
MDDFLKNARKQLEDLDLEAQLKDFDFGKLKDLDFKKQRKEIRRQLEELDARKREEDAANEGFLGGLLLGVVIGAIIALIFAPKSGSETREMVADTATGLKHKAEEMVGQAKDEASEDSSLSQDDIQTT